MSHTLVSLKLAALSLAAALVFLGSARGAVIFESAINSPVGASGGAGFGYDQYLGARFSVETTTQVTAVGGNIGSGDSSGLFAAIIKLSGPSALPRTGGDIFNLTPFNPADVVAHTVFVAPRPSADIRIPMSTTLTPGWYGLVYGSYQWGAYGYGYMPRGGQALPGTSCFAFDSGSGAWHENDTSPGWSFVVEGTPEPASALLLLTGIFISFRRRARHP